MDTKHDNQEIEPRGDAKEQVKGISEFGMWLFITALSVLFTASLVGYLVIRLKAPEWPPVGAPPLPLGLYLSTFVLIGSSLTLHGALDSARKDRLNMTKVLLASTLFLGIVFLISQAISWSSMITAQAGSDPNLYSFTFFVLTTLHAVHVIGGIIPLVVTTYKASKDVYSRAWNLPVKLMGMYWHFLLVVWLVMFAIMVVAG